MSFSKSARSTPAEYVPARSERGIRFETDLERVAQSTATLLLSGESGTGKSRAAQRLHWASPRSEEPFVEVQVAALSPTLVEAELFGHEEGAFTGAAKARLGRFQRANGGTLVLDGVESLPPELQVKLLRVLQERVVEPLGGMPVRLDVRVVATTSRDLMQLVETGEFRLDLYYRLAVVTLELPTLRSRLEDLPALVGSLSVHVAERTRAPQREFSAEALERLAQYEWPGNLRELENAIERVTVLGREAKGPVEPGELSFLQSESGGDARRLAQQALANGVTIEQFEWAMICEAVEQHQGNLSAAARQVGLSRRAVEYRLRKAKEGGEVE
jgi:DNA-binding NtrC family response regulator